MVSNDYKWNTMAYNYQEGGYNVIGITIQVPLTEAISLKLYARKNLMSRSTVYRMALSKFMRDNEELSSIIEELSKLDKASLLEINNKIDNME